MTDAPLYDDGSDPHPPRCSHPQAGPVILSEPGGRHVCPTCHVDLTPDGQRILDQVVLDRWEEHWKRIVTKLDGTLDLDQVKCELSDYWTCIEEVPRVYGEITGNAMSKPHYLASEVCRVHDERCPNVTALIEDLREVLEARGDHDDLAPLEYQLKSWFGEDPVRQRLDRLKEVLENHETLHNQNYRQERERSST